MMTLCELKAGESGVVITVGGEGIMRQRLLEMGLTPRTSVTVKRVAPFGDPIVLFLRDYTLTVRASDVENVVVGSLLN
jgi:Fe2+ transport system protein FeoA